MSKMSDNTDSARVIARTQKDEGGGHCWFCENEITPSYKDGEVLRSFLSPRGKILGKKVTAICSKHQRRLSREIKRAREMALL